MSTSDKVKATAKVKLTATARDRASEVFVIDAKLDRVARGIGSVEAKLPPGVYKVKVRAGQTTHEELVVLEKTPVQVIVNHLAIPSAVPLAQTAQSHEYHQAAAVAGSAKAQVRLGSGSSIFVFSRDWTPEGQAPRSGHHPAEGLALRSIDGKVLVDFEKESVADLTHDPCAACRVNVKPGPYLLSVTTATGERFEMTLFAQPSWQTQVFLLQRDNPASPRGRRPDLAGASVMMTGSKDFRPDSQEDRLAELARLALVDRRMVLSADLNHMLRDKMQNPMLGLLGAHLLLRQEKPNRETLRIVIRNLRALMSPDAHPHPDVEALAVAIGETPRCDFGIPPSLHAGWHIAVKASQRDPMLIPPGSPAARIAACVTSQQPWLVWRSATEEKDDCSEDLVSDLEAYFLKPKGTAFAGWGLGVKKTREAGAEARKLLEGGSSKGRFQTLAKTISAAMDLPPATVGNLLERAASKTTKARLTAGTPKKPAGGSRLRAR